MCHLVRAFKAARKVSTPLIAIASPDPAAVLSNLISSYEDNPPALIQWDSVRGLLGLNELGGATLVGLGTEAVEGSANPVEALVLALRLPERSILFMHNLHRHLDHPMTAQAVWNLRDPFKGSRRTLVMLSPSLALPPELSQDVWVLEERLPNREELESILLSQYEAALAVAELPALDAETTRHAIDAVVGLSAFPAEQAIALSISPEGLDIPALWERKRRMIEQTPGLAVWRGGETFADIGGVENARAFLTRLLKGRKPPRAVVFLDEIEKALAGSTGDSTGVSQSYLGTLLSWMQDKEAQGCLFLGPPGAAKSAVAKATGNTVGIPTISFDLSSMKSSLVGESESRLRSALQVVEAVSQGQALFLATCNSLQALVPEIRRRFKEATFFFDLPDREERKIIWKLYLRKFELAPESIPEDAGWTGAEIKQCCELAYRLDCSLMEASAYVVPVSKSAFAQIEALRTQAQGRFLSASYPGLYDKQRNSDATSIVAARSFTEE